MNQIDHDRRSLAWHKHISAHLRENPYLLEKAKNTLNRWLLKDQTNSRPYFIKWKEILDAGLDVTVAAACEESERADALRQNSPLSCVLSPQERWNFWKTWRA